MERPVILLSGGTGVGTSTYSLALAGAFHIPAIVSTDSIREVIRSVLHPALNPAIGKSTYLAGQTENYSSKSEEVQRTEIIRAFKNQCSAVSIGIEANIRRAIEENYPLIVEGAHVIPGKIRTNPLYASAHERIVELAIHIEDESRHRLRFEQRAMEAPQRESTKYIDNFKEIRWIQEYLMQKANENNIPIVINDGTIQEGMGQILSLRRLA